MQERVNRGGWVNEASGAGTERDRITAGGFTKSPQLSRGQLDVIYEESWAAEKFIDTPVKDATVRWRAFDVETSRMAAAEAEFDVANVVTEAMRGARLYGGGIIVMVTKEGDVSEELDIEEVVPGDLVNLLVFVKPEIKIENEWLDSDINNKTYGQPLRYRIKNIEGDDVDIHHSRVVRFDGLKPPGVKYFGDTMLKPVMITIREEAEVASNLSYLIGEASILIYRPDRFREILAGNGDPSEADPEQVLQNNVFMRSVFRAIVADKKDDVGRISINFSGLSDVYDRFVSRVAAAMDIPATRLWGKSPIGMNATGDSDWNNYALLVESIQKVSIGKAIMDLDEVLARHAGMQEVPPYHWVSLAELSETDRVEISRIRNIEMRANYLARTISPAQWMRTMDGDTIVGSLEEEPEPPEPPPPPVKPISEPAIDGNDPNKPTPTA